ncbi:MAG: protease modulator HflC [Verrucomicrobia bacterium]|nr:protease modulator HflC [Verrucomicrobiota bacterium]
MRNPVTFVLGLVILLIFGSISFLFQVRQNEVAFLTTFGKADEGIIKSGLHLKLPWPIQKVHRFDARVHNFEGKFEEAQTLDQRNVLVLVYVGWRITEPQKFNRSFPGGVDDAKRNLESLIRSAKNAAVGRHPFSHFINTDPAQLKFEDIEKEMLQQVAGTAKEKFGLEIKSLGIKRLGFPESVTQKVFERMKEERQRLVKQFEGEGDREASIIRSKADRDRSELLAKAEAEATTLRGKAEAEAAKAYKALEQNPELAVFLQKLSSMEQVSKERATLILDQNTPPFDLLRATNSPARPAGKK